MCLDQVMHGSEVIDRLAKGEGKVAKTMREIYGQSDRLVEKQNHKHK